MDVCYYTDVHNITAPNSLDLNPLDYHVWEEAMLESYHKLQPKPKKQFASYKTHCI